jgi:hypothetical protein
MERGVRGNPHAPCGAGEKLEIASNLPIATGGASQWVASMMANPRWGTGRKKTTPFRPPTGGERAEKSAFSLTGALLPLLKFGTACVLPLETQFSSVRDGMRGLFSIREERAIDVANFPNFNISFSNFSRASKDSVITFNR